MPMGYPSCRWLGLLIAFAFQICDIHSFINTGYQSVSLLVRYATSSSDDEDNKNCEEAVISTVKIDDGSSDLTDRFKYKVQALMGTYDPVGVDDDKQTANIVGALLQFPTSHTFTAAVGKKSAEDDGDEYANSIKSKLESILGTDAKIEMRVVPRGNKFTKVTITVDVESQGMITNIYDELDSYETVMKFYAKHEYIKQTINF